MGMVNRIFGYVHILLALVIAAQFILSSTYDDDAVADVWSFLNYLIALGAILSLLFSFIRTRNADDSILGERIASNAMLLGAAALVLLFFEQWFATELFADDGYEIPDYRNLVWIAIDVLFVIVNFVVGAHLLRTADSGE